MVKKIMFWFVIVLIYVLMFWVLIGIAGTAWNVDRKMYRVESWRCPGSHGQFVPDFGQVIIDEYGQSGHIDISTRSFKAEFSYAKMDRYDKSTAYYAFDEYSNAHLFIVEELIPRVIWVSMNNGSQHVLEFKVYDTRKNAKERRSK